MGIEKQSWNKALVKYGKWYLISSFLTKGLSFVLMPIYTKNISQADYGILQSFNSIIAFLPLLLSCCLDSAYARFYHNVSTDKKELCKLYSTIYWFIVLYGSIVMIIIFCTSGFWMKKVLTVPVFPYAYIAFIPALFQQLAQLGYVHLEQSLETKKITFLGVTSAALGGGVSIVLLLCLKLGFLSRLIGIGASSLYLWGFYYIFSKRIGILKWGIDRSVLRECLKFSIPLMPAMMGSWLSAVSDRLIIAVYVDMAIVGLYSFAFQLSSLVYVFGDAITRVLGPLTMSGLVNDKESTKTKIINFSIIVWAIMLYADLLLFLFSKNIVSIMGTQAYEKAYLAIPLLGFVYVIGMQQRFPIQVVQYHKKTWVISVGCIIMGVVNILLNLVFVPKFGYNAAIASKIVSNLVYVIWSFVLANRYENIEYDWKKMGIIFGVFIICFISCYFFISIKDIGEFLEIGIKIIVSLTLFVLFVYIADSRIITNRLRFLFK